MDNKIKKFIYFYREFEFRFLRNEVEEVDQFRDKWVELMDLAD